MKHDKISFVKEYCLCRKIPCKVHNGCICIDKEVVVKNVDYFTYTDLIRTIDSHCVYDPLTMDFMTVTHF